MDQPFWTDRRVRAALALPDDKGSEIAFSKISTDTRTIGAGDLFVALRGERFDAHEFLDEAMERGARGAIVDSIPEEGAEGLIYYEVDDTLRALGELARYYRRHLTAKVAAIVGSNGKTTTKELARAAIGQHLVVHATEGNLNNLIGVPLTLLAAPRAADVLVIEVGTNTPGEVARLGRIVEPDLVVITSIAEEHLEGLGDLEGVLREETSILESLPPGGVALVADEPPALIERARAIAPRIRIAGWGSAADPDLSASQIVLDEEGRVSFLWRGAQVSTPMRGRINARNALLALGLAEEVGVPMEVAIEGIGRAEGAALRSEFLHCGELMVIADCYNSNPASLEAAVELLTALPRRGGRIAIVGSMRELGAASAELHSRSASHLARSARAGELDLIVATGEFVEAFESLRDELGEGLLSAEDPVEVYGALKDRLRGDEVILLKGSRGVALERLIPLLEKEFGDHDETGAVGADAGRALGE